MTGGGQITSAGSPASKLGQEAEEHHRDFPSAVQATVTITNSSTSPTLPSVVVAGLSARQIANISKVTAILLYGIREDTSTAINRMNAAAAKLQVDKTGGTWVDAVDLIQNTLEVAASGREGGSPIFGIIDVKAEVDDNDTYELRFSAITAVGNNLILRDVQVILRIEWTL